MANDLDVTIFNFDLAKPEYLNMEDSDFYDYAHMSGKGAEKFSLVASELVKKYMDGEEIDKKEYFYNSYEELLDNSPWIFNIQKIIRLLMRIFQMNVICLWYGQNRGM